MPCQVVIFYGNHFSIYFSISRAMMQRFKILRCYNFYPINKNIELEKEYIKNIKALATI